MLPADAVFQAARFVLVNDSDKDYHASLAYGIDYERDPQYATEKSRLHCTWRRSNPVRGGAAKLDHLIAASQTGGKNNIDTRHTILEAKGRGHYLGNFLQVDTKNPGWWGEGVTVFHVDGRTMVHTPGTEDEYGSCWEFARPFPAPIAAICPAARAATGCTAGTWPTRCGFNTR